MMKRLLLICNPKAGRGMSPERLMEILRFYGEAGFLPAVYFTHPEEDFRELGPFIKGCRSYFLQAYKESSTVLDLSAGFGTPKKEELLSYAELVSPYVEKVDIRGVD